jgi:hypothetical protein
MSRWKRKKPDLRCVRLCQIFNLAEISISGSPRSRTVSERLQRDATRLDDNVLYFPQFVSIFVPYVSRVEGEIDRRIADRIAARGHR